MNYYIEKTKQRRYSNDIYRVKVSSAKFFDRVLKEINEDDSEPFGVVSTEIGRWPFKKHILWLDCDSEDRMIAACHWLKFIKIDYMLIKSSQDRYWVVCDYIGKFSDVYDIMKKVPGVDQEFVGLCRKSKKIFVRVVPKVGRKLMNQIDPTFPIGHTLKNLKIVWWLKEFQDHFNSFGYRMLKKSILMNWALRTNSMGNLMSDPSFQV